VGKETIKNVHLLDSLVSTNERLSTRIGETSIPPILLALPDKTIGGAAFVLLLQLAGNLPTGRACKEAHSLDLWIRRLQISSSMKNSKIQHFPEVMSEGVTLQNREHIIHPAERAQFIGRVYCSVLRGWVVYLIRRAPCMSCKRIYICHYPGLITVSWIPSPTKVSNWNFTLPSTVI